MTDFERFAELVNQRIKQETEEILETVAELTSKIEDKNEEKAQANEKLKESMCEALNMADKKIEVIRQDFRIAGRLIKSLMDTMLTLHSEVTMCDDDKKGLEALLGKKEEE